jgi:hypothetical protein
VRRGPHAEWSGSVVFNGAKWECSDEEMLEWGIDERVCGLRVISPWMRSSGICSDLQQAVTFGMAQRW